MVKHWIAVFKCKLPYKITKCSCKKNNSLQAPTNITNNQVHLK